MTLSTWKQRAAVAALASSASLGGLLGSPAPASAFSDPASFALPPLAAGGDGRYFTGSPADGFTCKVCHDGGPEPKLKISGLPLSGYLPGERYEIVVSWPSEVVHFAAALELTDLNGLQAGRVRLPSEGEVEASEYCEPASDAILAASIHDAPNERAVINVPDCGSQRLRFLWTAPNGEVGPVWFAGSAVWSDGESDPDHDGTTDFGRVLGSPASAVAVASTTTAGCSLAAGSSHTTYGAYGAWTIFGSWLLRLRRRARRRPPSR